MQYCLLMMAGWFCWCWLDGMRDAYTFAVSQVAESQRITRHWRYSTVHWLLFSQRILPAAAVITAMALLTEWSSAGKMVIGMLWAGDRIRNGAMRIEQGRSFFEGGHRWFQTMPLNCPGWLLWVGWPVVSCRRLSHATWLWEFLELNGTVSLILAALALIGSIAWVTLG